MVSEIDLPVFMGVCESALIRGDGVLQDFYGAGDLLLLPYFPQKLSGVFLLIGLPKSIIYGGKGIRFIAKNRKSPNDVGYVNIKKILTEPADAKTRTNGFSKHCTIGQKSEQIGSRLLISPDLIYKLIPIPCPPIFVTEPAEIDIFVDIGETEVLLSFE